MQLILESGSYIFFVPVIFCDLFHDAVSNWNIIIIIIVIVVVVVVVVNGSTALCWALASSSVS
jgi:Flp pilus assembly protein protease CpaA